LYAVLGLGVFAVGASYLRLQIRPDPIGFQVSGGDLLASGWPATYRIRARSAHLGQGHQVRIHGATLAGASISVTSRDADPLIASLSIPADLPVDAAPRELVLDVEAGQTRTRVAMPMAVTATDPVGETAKANASALPPTRRTLRLELHPEAHDLVSHLPNTVFVRVRDVAGRPVAGASIVIEHPDFVAGRLELVTDGAGLASFGVTPKRPNLDLRATVTAGANGESRETFNETLFSAGRQLLFKGLPPTLPPERAHRLELLTTRDGGEVHCDLRRGRTHVAAWRLTISAEGPMVVDLPPLARAGRYDLQCYLNILIPGATFASRAFWVADEGAIGGIIEAAERSGLFTQGSLEVPESARSGPDTMFAAWLIARLSERGVVGGLLHQTFDKAVAEADARWETAKSVALGSLALVILMILLVGLDLVLQNILANRRRFRAYEAELADGGVGDVSLDGVDMAPGQATERLSRTRGWLFMVVAIGTLLANIIGFLMLSGMFRNI
jgi:hypothetical protein